MISKKKRLNFITTILPIYTARSNTRTIHDTVAVATLALSFFTIQSVLCASLTIYNSTHFELMFTNFEKKTTLSSLHDSIQNKIANWLTATLTHTHTHTKGLLVCCGQMGRPMNLSRKLTNRCVLKPQLMDETVQIIADRHLNKCGEWNWFQ